MGKHSTCVMLILAFLQTGRSNSRIFTSQRREKTSLILTCDLSGEDNVLQINWQVVKDYNQTILGILHYQFGTHISQEHSSTIRIERDSLFHSTSLALTEPDANNDTQYCCLFITFPSGTLQDCIEVTDNIETAGALEYMSQVQPETLLLMVFVIPIVILMATVYCGWHHICSRRKVFEVQQSDLSDLQVDSEESTEGSSQPVPENGAAQSLDSVQVYAKINRYYERLWKACQAAWWACPSVVHPGVHRIYYLLGEHKKPEREEKNLLQP